MISTNMHEPQPSLTTLPAEIRFYIYEYVLTIPCRLAISKPTPTLPVLLPVMALLLVNHQIHKEATSIFYRVNSFHIFVNSILFSIRWNDSEYGLTPSIVKSTPPRVAHPIPTPYVPSLRHISLRLGLQEVWPSAPPTLKGTQVQLSIEVQLSIAMSYYAYLVNALVDSGAMLSVLSFTFCQFSPPGSLPWKSDAAEFMDSIDLDGALVAAVKRLVGEGSFQRLGRLEIWKEVWPQKTSRDWDSWDGPLGIEALWNNEPEQALKVKKSWPVAKMVEFGIRNINLEGERSGYAAVGTAISF